jgi:hypothetical protein
MTKRSIENNVEDLESEHGAVNQVPLDPALRALRAAASGDAESAGAFLCPDADPPPTLTVFRDRGFVLVRRSSDEWVGGDSA